MRWAFRELKNKIVVVIITTIIKADKQKTRQPLEKTNLTATSKCNLILPLSQLTMTDAHSTAAEATSTSEGENGGRNQHQGSFGTLGASSTYTGDSKQCPEEILTQGPCSGQYVTAWLPYGLATLMPGRDVSFTLLNHLLLSILQRAKALLVDTCYKPCTRSTLSP